ncbi:Domain of uncharacterised function (DUF2825) [Corynebacterium urealyticum]|nr:Domain of uncharacterised function (DUF2825) [Corynebacterium urealyticum]
MDILHSAHGSSPLARGAHDRLRQNLPRGRLIPAGAGSTAGLALGASRPGAHPRWRGEHPTFSPPFSGGSGSSPLARGALLGRGDLTLQARLIPAGAGSTQAQTTGHAPFSAHPRWRGEHRELTPFESSAVGSSPLARGAQSNFFSQSEQTGLIPAGAGSTSNQAQNGVVKGAHPRWRGEHALEVSSNPFFAGSSPLARGAHAPAPADNVILRLIPAGAGSTLGPPSFPVTPPAHPRWRGEHSTPRTSTSFGAGSSPLARGARVVCGGA